MSDSITPDVDAEALARRLTGGPDPESLRSSEARRRLLERWADVLTDSELSVDFVDEEGETARVALGGEHPEIEVPSWEFDQPLTALNREAYDLLVQRTLTLHEVGHVLFTDGDALTQAKQKLPAAERDVFHMLFNALEDGAIEEQLRQRFDVADDLTLTNGNFRYEYSEGTRIYDLLGATQTACLNLAVHDSGHLAELLDETDGSSRFDDPETRSTFESDVLPELKSAVVDVLSEPDPQARTDRILDLWKAIREHFDDLELPDDSQRPSKDLDPQTVGNGDPADDLADTDTDAVSGHVDDVADGTATSPAPPRDDDDGTNDATPDREDSESASGGEGTDDASAGDSSGTSAESGGDSAGDDADSGGSESTARSERGDSDSADDTGDQSESGGESGDDGPSGTAEGADDGSGSQDDEDSAETADDGSAGTDTESDDGDEAGDSGIDGSTPADDTGSEDAGDDEATGDDGAAEAGDPGENRDAAVSEQSSRMTAEGASVPTGDDSADADSAGGDSSGGDASGSGGLEDGDPVEDPGEEDATRSEADVEEKETLDRESASDADEELERKYDRLVERQRRAEADDRTSYEDAIDEYADALDKLQSDGLEPAELGIPDAGDRRQAEWRQIRRKSNQLKRILDQRLQQERRSKRKRGRRRGKLDPRSLPRLARSDPRVFQKEDDPDQKEYRFVFVLDRSGSMGSKIEAAERALVMLSHALEQLDIEVSIVDMYRSSARLAKPFGVQTKHSLDRLLTGATGGSTPLSEVLRVARERVEGGNEVPAMIVLTDGQPNDPQSYLEELKRTNFPVLGVYLDLGRSSRSAATRRFDGSAQFYDRRKIVIDEAEIADDLRALCREVMF